MGEPSSGPPEGTPRGGAFPEISGSARTSQSQFLRSLSQTSPPPQPYILPQQPETAAAPASISAVSSAISLSSLPREPGALSGYQPSRTPAAATPFSPSSSAISLLSTAAEDAYGDPGDPSSSGQGQARGITTEELAAMDPKRAKRLIANRQSAQRSKARKVRQIVQLEDKVQSLQGITQQQQARLGGLQQDIALLSNSNQQLSMKAAELQSQVGSYKAYTEVCVQEMRRLSMLAGEPFQLPAVPLHLEEAQMAQQVPTAHYGAPDLGLQQQLAAQGRMPGAMQNPVMPQQPAPPQEQQSPVAYARQAGGAPRVGIQRGPGALNLSSSYPPVYAQPMGRGDGRSQRGGRHQRTVSAGMMYAQGPSLGAAQAQPSELRLSVEPLPQRAASGHLEGGEAQGGGEMLTSAGVVQEAARQALAMAERHRLQASGEQQPQRDAVQAAIAAAEARHAALSAEGRGQPLQRGMSRTLSSQAGSMGGSFGRDEGGRIAQLPGMRADPFRGAIPASAFRMEEHSPTGGQDAPQTPGRRRGQMQQQLAAMPEQQAVMDMGQYAQPVGWPLGPRVQQPYPAVSVSSVGSVVQAFRGLNVHGSDPTGYGLTPRGTYTQQLRMQSQLPLLQGRYASMSWDEMMRSLSDPIYQYDAQGNPSFPQGLYPQASQISHATYDMVYNPDQQHPGEESTGHQPRH